MGLSVPLRGNQAQVVGELLVCAESLAERLAIASSPPQSGGNHTYEPQKTLSTTALARRVTRR
jgi:hypothetical protein